MAYNRRRRFTQRTRVAAAAAVVYTSVIVPRKKKCGACSVKIEIGETAIRLRLKKIHQQSCGSCGHKPSRVKYFHPGCKPQNIDKAMGYDGSPAQSGAAVPPPMKPKTIESLELEALAALETCVVARAARQGITHDLEAQFKTFQNIKARVLRPGTPGEGEVATSIALQRIIKMVFAN